MQWLREQRRDNPAFRPGYGSFACSEQEAREAIALNHGSLANIDDHIGLVMARLRALGLDEHTVVMFTSDHGDLLGERGLMFKGGLHYPALTRVPFIWRDGAQAPATAATAALTQTIDIAATVLERAGLEPTNGMQGASLLPVVTGQASGVRQQLLIEEESQRSDFGMDRRVRMRTLRNHDHRLTVYDGQPWASSTTCGRTRWSCATCGPTRPRCRCGSRSWSSWRAPCSRRRTPAPTRAPPPRKKRPARAGLFF